MKRALVIAAAAGAFLTGLAVQAAPETDPLQRPSLMVRQPERSVLLGVARAGSRVVAVGERGIIAVSDDEGRSWRQIPSPVSVTLTAVRFADPRNGVIVGHGGVVLTTSDGGATWTTRLDGRRLATLALNAARASGSPAGLKQAQRLVDEGPDKPLLDIALFDAARFVVVGAYGIVFATEDSGKTWSSWSDRLENPKGLHLYVARINGDQIFLAGEQGLIFRSSDRGASFKSMPSPYKGSWFAGEMSSSSDVVLAGLRGNAWRTTDAGASWTQISNPVPASITATAKAGDTLLFASQSGVVMKLQGDRLAPINSRPLAPLSGLIVVGQKLLATGVTGLAPVAENGK
jgi:photosystem II stability/assembly factor-like uncharacterized protein